MKDVEKWQEVVTKAYRYVYKELGLDVDSKKMEKSQIAKVMEVVYNTCILLKNEFLLIVHKQ
jgi:hypothetical protein